MERAFLHKSKTAGFGNIEARRTETFETLRNARHSRRAQDFNKHRKIEEEKEPEIVPEQAVDSRKKKELERKNALKKYIEEKEAKKNALKQKKRPPFVVGIPHHGSSPVLKDISNNKIGLDKKIKDKKNILEVRAIGIRVTRATTKGVVKTEELKKVPCSKNTKPKKMESPIKVFPFFKSNAKFKFVHSAKALTQPHTPEVLKRSTRNANLSLDNTKKDKQLLPNKRTKNIQSADSKKLLGHGLRDASLTNQVKKLVVSRSTSRHVKPLQTASGQASIDNSLSDQASVNSSTNGNASVNLTINDNASVNQYVNDNTSVNQSVNDNTSVNQSVNDNTSVNQSVNDNALFNLSVNGNASVNQSVKDNASVNQSVNDNPSFNLSVNGNASVNQSVNENALVNNSVNSPVYASVNSDQETRASFNQSLRRQATPQQTAAKLVSLDHSASDNAVINESADDDQAPAVDHHQVKLENPEVFRQRERVRVETAELLELADTWQQVTLEEELSQDLVDEIDSLVGQTRLLTRDKFQQFVRIIDEFETPKPNAPLVSIDDVEGFWDMIYLQVSPLKKRYSKLEELKRNNWEVPNSPPKRKRVKRVKRDTAASKPEVTKRMPRKSVRTQRDLGETLPSASTSPQFDEQNILLGIEQTPRKSLRLARGVATPLLNKACSYCDSPDCKDTGCRITTATSGKKSKSVQAKTFLNSSTLLVLEASSSETVIQPSGRKSTILQVNNTAVAEHTPRKRSARSVALNNDDEETMRIKLPVTPYHRSNTGNSARKSSRLAKAAATPILSKACSYCDSPDCKDAGCTKPSSTSGKESKHVQAKKFILKPSSLIVPEAMSETTAQPKGRKSRRLQDNEAAAPEHTLRTRSSRSVAFNYDDEEKPSMKLPVTPYHKSSKRTTRTPTNY